MDTHSTIFYRFPGWSIELSFWHFIPVKLKFHRYGTITLWVKDAGAGCEEGKFNMTMGIQ